MYGIPKELNLSAAIGQFTTQIGVGQFDIQFTFGDIHFAILSPVNLFRDGKIIAHWEEGKWPDPGFFEIMNSEVTKIQVLNDKLIVMELENGIEIHLADSYEQYESMQISIEGDPTQWII